MSGAHSLRKVRRVMMKIRVTPAPGPYGPRGVCQRQQGEAPTGGAGKTRHGPRAVGGRPAYGGPRRQYNLARSFSMGTLYHGRVARPKS